MKMKCTKYFFFFLMLAFSLNGIQVSSAKTIGAVDIKSLPETIGLEHADRVKRLSKFSKLYGITPPQLDEIQVGAGQVEGMNYPIPVVRVLFEEDVFFDFDKDVLHSDGQKAINVIAKSLKRDVPDVKLLVLGHTGSIGTDAHDIDLSKRRALNIMKGLIARGISPETMTAVAIGKSQPVATNNESGGRAKNRRVEFMISASQEANLSLVRQRRVISDYFMLSNKDESSIQNASKEANLFGLKTGESGEVSLEETGHVQLQTPEPLPVMFNKPLEYHLNKLNNEFRIE